tara:strand:- start:282 stop:434 length:153 start_codon:yes stop_codon:yes gene_type:complete
MLIKSNSYLGLTRENKDLNPDKIVRFPTEELEKILNHSLKDRDNLSNSIQ